jgi:UDP-GlcNAc:undecaprenyl-phosphate GlcNAc-1-phosphate transferase
MSGSTWDILVLCGASAAMTAVICYWAGPIGRFVGVIDEPDGDRRFHAKATPLMGGPAILVPALTASFVCYAKLPFSPIMLFALAATVAAFVIGLLDDRHELSAVLRVGLLTATIIAVLIFDPLFVLHTLAFKIFGLTLSVTVPNILAAPFVVLMMLGFVNAANMADGMNGQLLGSVMLWSAFIVHYMGFYAGLPFVFLICSAMVALVFNLRGNLFTGSSGAYAASLFVGFGAIAAYRLGNGYMAAQVPVYWFWLPVLDCVRLMASRIMNGQSPFAADRDHFHHLLLESMRPSRALALYLVLLAAPGVAAMFGEGLASTILVLCVVFYCAFLAATRGRLDVGRLHPRLAKFEGTVPRQRRKSGPVAN